jgi:4-hydroxybenzoate polyprenyltransferase
VAYDGWLKSSPFASVIMASCRYLNWLLGFAVVALTWSAVLLALPVFVYVLALTLLSRVETSASDRRAVLVSATVMSALALLLVAFILAGLLPNPWALPLVAAGLCLVLHRMWLTWRAFTPSNIQGTVGLLVMGVIPLDALMLLAAGLPWGSLLVIALLLPGRLLSRWLYVT